MASPVLARVPRQPIGREPVLHPEFAGLEREFAAAAQEASLLADGLHDGQFNWRPGAHRWSLAECLIHLNLVGERCARVLEETLADPRTRGLTGCAVFSYGWLGRWIIAETEAATRHRFRTPRAFQPVAGQPPLTVLTTFCQLQQQFSAQLHRTSGLDLARVKAPAPAAPLLRFNLPLTFTWIAAHQRRHLWQARQVRDHAMFPSGPAVRGIEP